MPGAVLLLYVLLLYVLLLCCCCAGRLQLQMTHLCIISDAHKMVLAARLEDEILHRLLVTHQLLPVDSPASQAGRQTHTKQAPPHH